MAKTLWAILHAGTYDCYDFIPTVDKIQCCIDDTLDDILLNYDDQKKDRVRGAFIVDDRAIDILCGSDNSPRMISHYLKSLASSAIKIVGILPGIEEQNFIRELPSTKIPRLRKVEALADEINSRLRK